MQSSAIPDATAPESRQLIGLPTLMTMAFNNVDLNPTADALLERIKADPQDATALMDMAVIFIMRGNTTLARSMQTLALQTRQIFHYPRPDVRIKIRALAILGPGDLMANSPFEFLTEHQPVALDLLYITPAMFLPQTIPEHDVLIVAIAESDANQALLASLEQALADWPVPVINRPARISQLSRDTSCALLASIAGVLMPGAQRVQRALLEDCCRSQEQAAALSAQLNGIDYPIIIRPIDSHAGQGLSKIVSRDDLALYLINSTEQIFFVSQFIDYRSADGLFRKYRVILIDGTPYLCHMAFSQR